MKKENGITLIALIVTIIILLILSGVSLNLIIGNDGIVKKASNAADITKLESEKEFIKLEVANSFDERGIVNLENIQNMLEENKDYDVNTDPNYNNLLSVHSKNTNNEFLIDKQGNVEELNFETFIYKYYDSESDKYAFIVVVPLKTTVLSKWVINLKVNEGANKTYTYTNRQVVVGSSLNKSVPAQKWGVESVTSMIITGIPSGDVSFYGDSYFESSYSDKTFNAGNIICPKLDELDDWSDLCE